MLEILDAKYGSDGSEKDLVDVTQQVKALVSSDGRSISVTVSASKLGVTDPSPGNPKVLIVKYSKDGEEKTDRVLDGNTFAVSLPPETKTGPGGATAAAYTALWKNGASALIMFLNVFSVIAAFNLGAYMGNSFLWAILSLLFPYGTFWLIAPLVMLVRAFTGEDFIRIAPVMMGARR